MLGSPGLRGGGTVKCAMSPPAGSQRMMPPTQPCGRGVAVGLPQAGQPAEPLLAFGDLRLWAQWILPINAKIGGGLVSLFLLSACQTWCSAF